MEISMFRSRRRDKLVESMNINIINIIANIYCIYNYNILIILYY